MDVHECPVCLESYNEKENAPLLLTCGHAVCRSCVNKAWERKIPCYICRNELNVDPKKLTIVYALIPSSPSKPNSSKHSQYKAVKQLCDHAIKSVRNSELIKQQKLSSLEDIKRSQQEVYTYIDQHIDRIIQDLSDFKHKLHKELSDEQEIIDRKSEQIETDFNFSFSCLERYVQSILSKAGSEKISLEEVREQLARNTIEIKELEDNLTDSGYLNNVNQVCSKLIRYHERMNKVIETYSLDKMTVRSHSAEPTPREKIEEPKKKKNKLKNFFAHQATEFLEGIKKPFEGIVDGLKNRKKKRRNDRNEKSARKNVNSSIA